MVQIKKKSLMLIDGSSYLYRAYHALPSLVNNAGAPTGAMYGVLRMIRNLVARYHPTHVAIVFDAQQSTFREKIFKYYKSHRLPMPNNLCVQIDPLHAMIKAMGFALIKVSGVEADDVIGTLARAAEKIGLSVLISSNDKDMAQLVTKNVFLINTVSNAILGTKEVIIKYGIPPELIVDFIALMGDHSDNIPGVPGIGKKTALILLQSLGGINILYDKLEKIPLLTFRGAKTVAAKLKKNKDMVYLAYQLATIQTEVKIQITFEALKVQQPAIEELLYLFRKYNFKRWVTEIEEGKWASYRDR